MAIPSLAAMAALTLFHNPHMQPEDVSVPFGEGYSAPARVIQRRQRRRRGAVITRIQKIIRSYLARARTLLGPLSPDPYLLVPRAPTPRIRENPYLALLIPWRGPLDQRSRRMNSARKYYVLNSRSARDYVHNLRFPGGTIRGFM